MAADTAPAPTTIRDDAEIERFGRIAAEWWDPAGKLAPLHQIGPARMAFVREECARHFGLRGRLRPLRGLRALDVGCGGGLVSEPLARMGADVTAIDPSQENIRAAQAHAAPQGLAIDYRATTLEQVTGAGETFDLVACLEVLEHVPDPAGFVAELARAVRPGGLLVVSTINRTVKAYALAIVGAEYVLRWLPAGTHRWDRFVTDEELAQYAAGAGLSAPRFEGIVLDPVSGSWRLSPDIDVNYLAAMTKPLALTPTV